MNKTPIDQQDDLLSEYNFDYTKASPNRFGTTSEKSMLQTIPGIYKNGKIELSETPQGITESSVFVTFLPAKPTTWPEKIINHQGIEENIIFESDRDELLPPQEIEL
jgi:hypothetical protein